MLKAYAVAMVLSAGQPVSDKNAQTVLSPEKAQTPVTTEYKGERVIRKKKPNTMPCCWF